MMIQQQGYPNYVGPQISPGNLHIRDESSATAVRVIKENENVRNMEFKEKRQSSLSPVDRSPYRRTPSPQHRGAFEPVKVIKRSSSIDNDEPLYDADSDDHRQPDECDQRETRYDSEPERDNEPRDLSGTPGHDEDAPLDLSVSAGRRRDRTYSGTDSDDSGGVGEEKAGGKAAYKKSLMKRYCKYCFVLDQPVL